MNGQPQGIFSLDNGSPMQVFVEQAEEYVLESYKAAKKRGKGSNVQPAWWVLWQDLGDRLSIKPTQICNATWAQIHSAGSATGSSMMIKKLNSKEACYTHMALEIVKGKKVNLKRREIGLEIIALASNWL